QHAAVHLARCLLRTLHGILPWFSTRQNRHCRHHPPQETKERWGSSLASGSERDSRVMYEKWPRAPCPSRHLTRDRCLPLLSPFSHAINRDTFRSCFKIRVLSLIDR